jgi:Ulp1 family protease
VSCAQSLPEEVRKRVHFFNTFFYKKLSQKSDNCGGRAPAKDGGAGGAAGGAESHVDAHKAREWAAHERVKKWTKNVDLFDKARAATPWRHACTHQ